jgi:Reverse transcriptase (RNA-dependent DNA polymerase)
LSGGGVIVAVKKELESHRIETFESDHPIEDIWVKVSCRGGRGLLINAVYVPCRSSFEVIKNYTDNFSLVSSEFPDDLIFLIGDFNQPNIQWATDVSPIAPCYYEGRCSDLLIESFNFCGFEQFNSCLNTRGRILDLVLSNSASQLINVIVAEDELSIADREHPPLFITLTADPEKSRFDELCPTYNFKKANFNAINDYLDLCSWCDMIEQPTDQAVALFYELLNQLISSYVPKIKPRSQKHPFWFSNSLIDLLRKKRKFRNDPIRFSDTRRLAKNEYKNCLKRRYQEAEASIKNDPKKFWSYAKELKKSGGFPNCMSYGNVNATDPSDISNLFATFFKSVHSTPSNGNILDLISSSSQQISFNVSENDVLDALKKLDCSKGPGPDSIPSLFFSSTADVIAKPLAIIFNKSLSEGVYPSQWKISFIIPIHKNGNKSEISNYRPISILNVMNKIFERIMHNKIFQKVHNIINVKQHGFFPKRSTLTNLLDFTSFLLQATSKGSQVDCIYTDFSKAFDKVDHFILLTKLARLGFSSLLLKWFHSYLTNRKQYVSFAGSESDWFSPTSGVPQGSILGPLLFLIFINDAVSDFHCSYLLYADDLKIFKIIDNISDCDQLQNDITYLSDWCNTNSLPLNVNKCKKISYTRRPDPVNCTYSIGLSTLENVRCISDLGILFDSQLRFDLHIKEIVSKANRMLGFICRVTKHFEDPRTLILLFNSLVRSGLEYNSTIWSPFYANHSLSIERVQKKLTRVLNFRFGISNESYPERIRRYKMISLEDRRIISDEISLFKLINNQIQSSSLTLLKFNTIHTHYAIRNPEIFDVPTFSNNYSSNLPIIRMQRAHNELFNNTPLLDISIQSFKTKIFSMFHS